MFQYEIQRAEDYWQPQVAHAISFRFLILAALETQRTLATPLNLVLLQVTSNYIGYNVYYDK